ncbi:hypothetical protein NGA_0687000, partial [Nannochloropsis gaditana CCMP526]|uniref:uncharacterized protein n=1 Tax=Nannochloropsis gaditana (strain CCMP526) TaxID=1093141 RepID=UPI00029F7870
MADRGGKSIFVAFWRTMELCSGPSVFMFLMSFAIFIKPPSVTFVNAMQHFGGGIVLSAVATELLPAMSRHKHRCVNGGS